MADEYTVTIDGTFFDEDKIYGVKVVKGLNEMWSFEFMVIDPDATQESKLVEENTVRITYNGNQILKGTLRTLIYSGESEEWHCSGYNKAIDLFDKEEFDRTEWVNLPASTIVTQLLTGRMNAGTIDTANTISFRAEYGNVMERLHSISRAVGYDWYIDEDLGLNDQFNFVVRLGSLTSTETLTLDEDLIDLRTWKDHDRISNELNVLGWGDGDLQKVSYIHAGTTIRTNLDGVLTDVATTVTVDDTTDFPTNGSVWVGMEKISYTGKTATTFTGCTRGTDLTSGLRAYEHSDGMMVRDAANDAASPETGSSIDKYGRRQKSYPARDITDQDTLDRLASTVLLDFEEPPEIVEATLISTDLTTAVLGDVVTFDTQDFRLTEIEYNQGEGLIFLKGGLTFGYLNEQISDLRKELTIQNQYTLGAPNNAQIVMTDDVEKNFSLSVPFRIPNNAVAVGALTLDLDLYKFRARATTSAEVTAAFGINIVSVVHRMGDHFHRIPSHYHPMDHEHIVDSHSHNVVLYNHYHDWASFLSDTPLTVNEDRLTVKYGNNTNTTAISIKVNLIGGYVLNTYNILETYGSPLSSSSGTASPDTSFVADPTQLNDPDFTRDLGDGETSENYNYSLQAELLDGSGEPFGDPNVEVAGWIVYFAWLNESKSTNTLYFDIENSTKATQLVSPTNTGPQDHLQGYNNTWFFTPSQISPDDFIKFDFTGASLHMGDQLTMMVMPVSKHDHSLDFGIAEDGTTVLPSCTLELYLNGTKLTDTNCPALASVTGWNAANDWLTGYDEYSRVDISNQTILTWNPGTRYELEVKSVNAIHNRCKMVAHVGIDTFLKGKKTIEG